MSFRIIGSLSEFKEKTSWPFYYYAEELKRRGFHPNFIEIFLRKLSREVPYGADPDQVLQSFIKEHDVDFSLDPYQYERPENIAGYWHRYYKERPNRFKKEFGVSFDLSQFELDDLIQESRSWGSKFYPVVDYLSNGFKMVKLTDEREMKSCGDDLSVCIGSGGGSTIRNEALSGQRELWALKDQYENTLAIASVEITAEGKRIIDEIRGYKNRGYIFQGYEIPIREWIERHPEYFDNSYSMTPNTELGGDAAYDIRGFYGDDDPEDWSDEYKELIGNSKDLIEKDISNLNDHLSEVIEDSDFIKKLIPKILDDSYEIEKDTLDKIFNKYPEYVEDAVNSFLNDKNDGDEKLIEVFFENEEANKIIKDFVVEHYCGIVNSDEEWIPWTRQQLFIAYNYYLLPEEKKQMKNNAVNFFNEYSFLSDSNTYFEIDFTLTNKEKNFYIPALYNRITKELEEYDDLIEDEKIHKFIVELRNYFPLMINNSENFNIILDFMKAAYLLSDETFSLNFFIEEVLKDKAKDFLIEEILPFIADDKKFIDIIYFFRSNYSLDTFLNMNSSNSGNDEIEKNRNNFAYIKKIFSMMPDSLREDDRLYQATVHLFSSIQDSQDIGSMLIEINNIYPLDFFKLLEACFSLYRKQNIKRAILNILYSKYGFEEVNKDIIKMIGPLEYKILDREGLIRNASLNSKMVKLLIKIDQKSSDITDNIEWVLKNGLYRNIKR